MEIHRTRLASLVAAGLLASASAVAGTFPVQIAADAVAEGKVLEVASDGSVVVKVKGVGEQRYQLPAGTSFPALSLEKGDKVTVGFLEPDEQRVDKRWVRIEVKNGATLEPLFEAVEAREVAKVAVPTPPEPEVKEQPKPAKAESSDTPAKDTTPSSSDTDYATPCFITTAVMTALGAADDGPELTLAREFRATFMQQTEERRADVAAYDVVAPPIVAGVEALPNASEIWQCVWDDYLAGIKAMIERGEKAQAHARYRQMVLDLNAALGLDVA